MSLCPPGSVSLAPLLLSSCRPVTQPSAGGCCEQVYFDVSAGKSTVRTSGGGGCLHSASLHRACGALLPVLLLVILAGLKLPQKLQDTATITPSLGRLGNTLSGKAAGGNLPLEVSCSLGSFVKA